jgi:hypothetical protein
MADRQREAERSSNECILATSYLPAWASFSRKRGLLLKREAFAVPITRSSIVSHAAAVAFGAIAVAVLPGALLPNAYSAGPQSLADYFVALCAKKFQPASAVEAQYLADNVSAMTKMMIDMGIKPSGDIDTDFVAMMVPHHEGAIAMAQAELRYGRNEVLKRLSQEIIVTQQQEVLAMRLALGQPLPSLAPAPDQVAPVPAKPIGF